MRKILFRGKKADNKNWAYGYIIETKNWLNYTDKTLLVELDAVIYSHCEISDMSIVIPETVSQFTGKYDKNGKKIFEGDIVRGMMDYGPAGMVETVTSVGFIDSVGGYQWNYFNMDTVEVIGNKWDNPELLKGE